VTEILPALVALAVLRGVATVLAQLPPVLDAVDRLAKGRHRRRSATTAELVPLRLTHDGTASDADAA
jgi:hypothetical protein